MNKRLSSEGKNESLLLSAKYPDGSFKLESKNMDAERAREFLTTMGFFDFEIFKIENEANSVSSRTVNEISHLLLRLNAKPSKILVRQGEFRIENTPLYTSGLGTCSALGFTVNGKNFLAHIDAKMNMETIYQSIENEFDIEEIRQVIVI